jgi:DNA-binding LacI/PurR family transcriptional regulator
MAIGFMKAVREAGLRVPEDVSVLGVDGIAMADLTDPPLSTSRQPRFEIGRAGGEKLLALIEGRPAKRLTTVPVELLRRGSTAPPTPRG